MNDPRVRIAVPHFSHGTGATTLIAGQNMHFCLGLASHATVIDRGQIVYTPCIEELKANHKHPAALSGAAGLFADREDEWRVS